VPEEPVFYVSPTEPPLLRSLGQTSPLVEAKGCDILIMLPKVRVGIQRKTWVDLVMSLDDGRLAGSIPKMDMAVKILVIEGKVAFDRDSRMVVRTRKTRNNPTGFVHLRYTRESLAGVALSLRYVHGLDVFYTDSEFDTAALVVHVGSYFGKDSHTGIIGRRTYIRGAGDSPWGYVTTEERELTKKINFLMGLGIGLKTAQNILAKCGGKMPLKWAMTREELMSIPLIGEATADRLMKMLE